MRVFHKAVLGLTFVFVALSACKTPAQSEHILTPRIDSLFVEFADGKSPGYAIGIISEGDLVFAKGYGLADIESGKPITPDTTFNIASLSKQFTAAAIAKDIQDGKMSLEDPLADHWPDLPDFMSDITIGHLIYMTSGLTDYYNLPSPKGGWASESRFTIDDAISTVLNSGELEYVPGSRWTYSNINYQLLAETSARKINMNFADLVAQKIFNPLGMNDSWVDSMLRQDHPNMAKAYSYNPEENSYSHAPRLSAHYGGSGVYSSLKDLFKWDSALYRDQSFGGDFTDIMLSTRQYKHDKANDAFGLVHGNYRDEPTIWYEGGDYGVSTYMARLPNRDQTVICLSNIGGGRCLDKARAVMDMLIDGDSN